MYSLSFNIILDSTCFQKIQTINLFFMKKFKKHQIVFLPFLSGIYGLLNEAPFYSFYQ